MSLKEKKIIDKIELTEFNTIQIRTATIIEKDGVEIAKTYHRHVVNPADDISNEDKRVQAIANAIKVRLSVVLSFPPHAFYCFMPFYYCFLSHSFFPLTFIMIFHYSKSPLTLS